MEGATSASVAKDRNPGSWSAASLDCNNGLLDGGEEADCAALAELRVATDQLVSDIARRVAEAGRREREAQACLDARLHEQAAWREEQARERQELDGEWAKVRGERTALDDEKARMTAPGVRPSDIVTLNVGGEKIVQRRRSTLCACEGSFLAARFSGRWESEADRDGEGRHFLNYPPELVTPLLDYLGMRETEGPGKASPLPLGPELSRPQFEAMLRFFGISPQGGAGVLDALGTPYDAVTASFYGLAFEVRAPSWPISLIALETCGKFASSATIFSCPGSLSEMISQPSAWERVGSGALAAKQASRLEISQEVKLRAGATQCLYIATDKPCGIAFEQSETGSGVSAENDDVQIYTGRFSNSRTHFDGFVTSCWYRYNGRLEYMVMP